MTEALVAEKDYRPDDLVALFERAAGSRRLHFVSPDGT
jgi:hypothetical protein